MPVKTSKKCARENEKVAVKNVHQKFSYNKKNAPPSPPTLNGDSGTGSKIIGCKALSRASILGHRNLLSAISFTIMWRGAF